MAHHSHSDGTTWSARIGAVLDLAIVGVLAIGTVGLATVAEGPGGLAPIRIGMGVLFVFVLPGYALTAALFPVARQTARQSSDVSGTERSSPSRIERVVISVGLSIFAVPLVALFVHFSSWEISAGTVLGGITVLIGAGVAIAAVRRALVPADQRFRIRYRQALGRITAAGRAQRRRGLTANIVIATLLLASAGLAGAAVEAPGSGEQYTEFYLLTEDPETGELEAEGFPSEFTVDDSDSVYVGITNKEGRTMDYTVVVELQRIGDGDDRRVVETVELDRYTTTVAPGETDRQSRSVRPDAAMIGEDLRLTFLLYEDAPPQNPTASNAYRETHLWIDVIDE